MRRSAPTRRPPRWPAGASSSGCAWRRRRSARSTSPPPHTTDFAILFVPTEGLYAEALRRPGLIEALQREHRVMLAGPTTLLATLNSLQMGFRTLALEKRSAEVWEVLGAVKTEFGKFGDVLAKTQKKLDEATDTIEAAETRTRVMARQLKSRRGAARAAHAVACCRRVDDGRRATRSVVLTWIPAWARVLVALIVGQICLHCVHGRRAHGRAAAGAARGPRGLGGGRADGAVRRRADRCWRCRPGAWPTATATTGRCASPWR